MNSVRERKVEDIVDDKESLFLVLDVYSNAELTFQRAALFFFRIT